jgi:hypothetical protein
LIFGRGHQRCWRHYIFKIVWWRWDSSFYRRKGQRRWRLRPLRIMALTQLPPGDP